MKLTTALMFPLVASKQLNIHVKVLSPSNTTISSVNRQITSVLSDPSDQKIDFQTTHDTHATLYLSTFLDVSISDLVEAANVALISAHAEFCEGGEGMKIGETKDAQGT